MIANKKKPTTINHWLEKSSVKSLPETREKAGSRSLVKRSAITNAIMLINKDSPRNCFINDPFSAPNTLRTPTSDERLEERAVERFMKLMHAISKVNKAIDPRMYRYVTLTVPEATISLLIPEYR